MSHSALSRLFTRLKLRRCSQVGADPRVAGRVWVHGSGRVRLGARVWLDGAACPIELRAGPGAEIVIGDGVKIEGGASVEAEQAVHIGDGAVLGALCKIMDGNFHTLVGDRAARPPGAPVVVEAGAQVGARAILLAGARVRAGTVVRPGAVVRGPGLAARGQGEPRSEGPASRADPGPLKRAADRLGWLLGVLRGRLAFRSFAREGRLQVRGRMVVVNHGTGSVGRANTFNGGLVPSRLVIHPGATFAIGGHGVVNYGVSIEAHRSIRIGRRVLMGSFVRICDREGDRTAPVVVGDDVWLAHGVVVAPGVTIGDGSVVSAGSVVTRDVPPGSLAVGNPARCMSLALAAGQRAPGAPSGGATSAPPAAPAC